MKDKLKKGDKVKVWSLQSFHGGGFLNGKNAVVFQDQYEGDSVFVSVERKIKGRNVLDSTYEVYRKQLELIESNNKDLCDWRDGAFYPCNDFEPKKDSVGIFCRGCKATINKPIPVPEVVIKNNGGTFAGIKGNIDYLWVGDNMEQEFQPLAILKIKLINNDPDWVPVSEIELTDETAKFRPMVIFNSSNLDGTQDEIEKLFGICEDNYAYTRERAGMGIGYYRLATISDLEDS